MNWFFHCLAIVAIYIPLSGEVFFLSQGEYSRIGEKIWYNESKNSMEGLTHWNRGENFPSLGIGHFIWYPEGVKERFEETFPQLLIFLEKNGVMLPDFLKEAKGSLWVSQEEFYKDFDSPQSQHLRRFLYQTRDWQIKFIVAQLNEVVPLMEQTVSHEIGLNIRSNFSNLLKDERGVYALIDYFNFKGAGLSEQESYQGQGWGLKQVLEDMDPLSKDPVFAFCQAAKTILKRRVEHSPQKMIESRWLKGWLKRVDSYTDY